MDSLHRNTKSEIETVKEEILTMIGHNLVDVELSQQDLNTALKIAFEKYRQRAENSVEESFMFMTLDEHTNDYVLPNEVIEVRKIYRKSFGLTTTESESGTLSAFEISFYNTYVYNGALGAGLATYEAFNSNLETMALMFGQNLNYAYNHQSKRLKVMRNVKNAEEVMLWIYNYIPDEELLKNTYARPWIRSYALCEAKLILAQAYSKFATLAGPQGGISMNGSELRAEAIQERMDLEAQLKTYQDGSTPLYAIFG